MTARPRTKDDEAAQAAGELDRILPQVDIDEKDPAFRERLKAAVEEALADPRPPIDGEEVGRRLRERHEARLRRCG
jgi:hypothetical protein